VGCIVKHLTESPASIRERRPDVPEALEAAILQALAKDRDARYPGAPDFAAALQAAVAPPPAAPRFAPPWRRRPPAPTLATAGTTPP
jgi:hypothetical protein